MTSDEMDFWEAPLTAEIFQTIVVLDSAETSNIFIRCSVVAPVKHVNFECFLNALK